MHCSYSVPNPERSRGRTITLWWSKGEYEISEVAESGSGSQYSGSGSFAVAKRAFEAELRTWRRAADKVAIVVAGNSITAAINGGAR